MWLPKLAELSTPSGLPDTCHDHPVILLSPRPLPNNEVVILVITSFGGKDLMLRHKHDYGRQKRAHYLPIDPSPAHPDHPDKNVVLKLGGGAVLRKNSWVNTETQYRVVFSLLRNYEWKTGKLFVLTPESYGRLIDFVGFRADEVVAGPSMSGPPDAEAEPAVTQTATPPLTPELGPVVVPAPVPEPVVRLPEVMEPARAHDSNSDTTIVVGDYCDSDRTRSQQSRDQVLNQPFAIIGEENHLHGSDPAALMGARRASYTTSYYGQSRQQAFHPVSPTASVPPSRLEMLWVLRQAYNERSSLLLPQPQAIASDQQSGTKPQATTPATMTGYGTLPSSSCPTAGEMARLQVRARAAEKITMLERRRPKHTWYSQLALPFQFDFVFFGTSSQRSRARARAFARKIASVRAQTGFRLGQSSSEARLLGGGSSKLDQYEGMITRSQARDAEAGIRTEMEAERSRLALWTSDEEVKGEGRLSMLAIAVLIFVILLIQATLLTAVVWSIVHFDVDKAIVEWIAMAAGNVVDAFWAVVEFLEFLLQIIFGMLCWAFIIVCLASCCCGQ